MKAETAEDAGNPETLLKGSGLRVTRQRLSIVELLLAASEFLSAEEILERIRGNENRLGLATVYRTLDTLASRNILDRLDLGNGRSYFGVPGGNVPADGNACRHLLVCERCRRIFNAKMDGDVCASVDNLAASVKSNHGFSVTRTVIHSFGRCVNCGN